MKKFLLALVFTFVATASIASNETYEALKPNHQQQITSLEIIRKLQHQHYEKHTIDDTFSLSFLNNYLKALDPNRLFFKQSDINTLYARYGNKLDDDIKRGNLDAGFEIFNLYRQSNVTLLEKNLPKLKETILAFAYSKDDKVQIDRSDAAWPKSDTEIQQLWLDRLKLAALNLRLAKKDDSEIPELLYKRYKNQLDRFKKLRSDDVFQIYMNALTTLYDPHTNYMSPVTSSNFDINMSLKLEGIGAILSQADEHTQIVRLIHAGPAQKQGELQPMDKIVAVAQGEKGKFVDVVGWRLDEVVDLIRGPKGSTVRLEVIPANSSGDNHKIITIVRDEVKLEEQSVQKATLDIKDKQGVAHKIGILDIPTFYIDFEALRKRDPNYKSTTRDTAKLLGELVKEGVDGIIIDLRNNGGGSLREANELTGLFIEKGPSVQIRHSNNRVYSEAKTYYAPYYDGPIVVLINRLSASASEIFAGAIQDYQRGIIVGSDSFGKGTVQSLSDLTHGKLKLTESKFYRISGKSTQHKGVIPDIDLPATYDNKLVGESTLDKAMSYDAIEALKHKQYFNLNPIIGELYALSKRRAANDPEFTYIEKSQALKRSIQQDYLSLNEQQRLRERDQEQAALLALLNEKRVAKGEKPLDSLDDKDAINRDAEEDEKLNDEGSNKIDPSDPYLIEAANILLDAEYLLNRLKIAKQAE